ncbi:MAG TPA: lipocalin family protein [Thermoanaerobaculia bacterium]|nr:lipocalin family protein [Thermoanaerobaculia bacterium]
MRVRAAALLTLLAAAWIGCRTIAPEPIRVPQVDLSRLMGDWYVIANIPTPFVKDAFNAVQSYTLNADGSVATTFTYREGSFDGKLKTLKPRAYVGDDGSNAKWGLQLGPILAEYLIAYVNPDYTETIVARNSRDFVWIMARTPAIPDADYDSLVAKIDAWGYNTEKLERVPQRW